MTRRQFQMLVILHVFLAFGSIFVQSLTDPTLSPELQEFLGVEESVVEAQSNNVADFSNPLYLIWIGLEAVTLVASTGLCLGRWWGRTLFLLCYVSFLLLIPFYEFVISTNWTALISTLRCTTEGMILALIYFSHLRRMFEKPARGDAND